MPRDAVSWLCVVGDHDISWIYLKLGLEFEFNYLPPFNLDKTEPIDVDKPELTEPRYGHQN